MIKSFKQFAQRLRGTDPGAEAVAAQAAQPDSAADGHANGTLDKAEALEAFFQRVPDYLSGMRNLFAEISRSPDNAMRQRILANLGVELKALRTDVVKLELVPANLIAVSLEGLVNQLAEKPLNVSLSTLRSAAGALVLLEALCVRGVRADLATNPGIRFLVVDDDPVSRLGVSLALKKFHPTLDAAPNGDAALEHASKQAYDIVFLDIEMPGMDGYEVCTKIHQTDANRATPVVFVTSHSDFASRSKSTSSGGRDLIAKPFLSFEITVKALTLVLRFRLDQEKARQDPKNSSAAPVQPTSTTAADAAASAPPAELQPQLSAVSPA